MTNEFFSHRADSGMVLGSTIERKKMSIKTLRKRIALVAVAVLGVSVITTSPAVNASDWSSTADILDCREGYTTTDDLASGCSGIVGGRVQIALNTVDPQSAGLTDATVYYISVTNARITQVISDEDQDNDAASDSDLSYGPGSSITATAGDVDDWPSTTDNTAADSDGLIELGAGDGAEEAGQDYFYLTADAAGTSVIELFGYNGSGVRTVVETHKITWLSAANAKISATESTLTTIATDTNCDTGNEFSANANGAADKASLAADAKTKMDAADTNGGVAYVCVIARDGNGVLLDNVDVEISISLGNLDDTLGNNNSTSSRESLTDMDKNDVFEIIGDPDEVGVASITATLTDESGNEVTMTGSFTFFGDIVSVELTQNTYALGNSDVDADAIYLVAKDAKGTTIPLDEAANGFAADATDLLVDSTYGTVATNADAKGEADDAATVTIADLNSNTTGVEAAEISITCHATIEEKLLITAYGTNDDDVDIKSNTITYYCSDVADKVEISASAATVAANGTLTLQVKVLDVNGYPVEDGTTVSIATTGSNAVVSGTGASSGTTINGGYAPTKLGTFIAGSQGGKATVTAVANGKSASTTISVTGGADSIDTQIASLVSAIAKLQKAINKIQKRLNVR